jgi:hypothetical protein
VRLVVIRYAKIHGTKRRPWLTALLARRPTKVAAIARQQDRPNERAEGKWTLCKPGSASPIYEHAP